MVEDLAEKSRSLVHFWLTQFILDLIALCGIFTFMGDGLKDNSPTLPKWESFSKWFSTEQFKQQLTSAGALPVSLIIGLFIFALTLAVGECVLCYKNIKLANKALIDAVGETEENIKSLRSSYKLILCCLVSGFVLVIPWVISFFLKFAFYTKLKRLDGYI